MHKSENDPEESIKTLDFSAEKANFLISDYQTFLAQFGVTVFDNYAILKTTLSLTGATPQINQNAINIEDGSMPPGWATEGQAPSKPVVEHVSIFLPKYGCQVVLATQSLEFLDNIMGEAQESGKETKIFRFEFENDHARVFPSYTQQEAIDSRELIGSDLRN